MSAASHARASFERVVTFLHSGDAATAEKLCRAALSEYPRDPNFLALLGAALTRLGRAAEAEPMLRDSLDQDPEYPNAHVELGIALLALDRPAEALPALRRALELNPALEAARLKLGQALLALGEEADARAVLDDFVGRKPQRQLLVRAAEHHRNGELEQAEKAYREILRQDPGNVSALRLLGLLAMDAEHYRDAVVLLERAVQLAPDFRAAWIDLGRAQTEIYELDAAVASYRRAIALEPGRVSAHIGLANALARSSRTAEAVAAYEQAAALNPEHAQTYLGLGNVLKTVGRQADAIAAYRRGIALRPAFAELYWSLSNLKTFRFEPAEITAMEAQLAAPALANEPATHFCFALGKAREDAGRFTEAFELFRRGNALRRSGEHYDPVYTEEIGERIRAVFTHDLLARNAGSGFRNAAPIFIVGLPRSGSTLVEQILASHHLVEATFELPEAGRLTKFIDREHPGRRGGYPEAVRELDAEQLEELGRRYDIETRRYRAGAPFFIDKMPNNFPTIGLLHLALPNARFIDARRHPLDTCLSCFKQLFARGQSFTYDLVELGEYYLEYVRMMAHWEAVLPGRVLRVQYEDVVADLETQARRLVAHCGLPWDDACLRFHETERPIRTASSEQVRRPIYTDAVGLWRHYERPLAPLIEILQPVLEAQAVP